MKANQNHILEPNKKVSSVDYLISQLQKSKDWQRVLNEVSQMSSVKIDIIEQAKQMHREEMKNIWDNAAIDASYGNKYKSFEQYYNETFQL